MLDITRYYYIKKYIKVYNAQADVLELIKPVVLSFAGKCFNKNFAEALDKKANEGADRRKFLFSADKNLAGNVIIRLSAYDNFISEKDEYGHSHTYYTDNDSLSICSPLDKGDSKYRINATSICMDIDKKIDSLRKQAKELEEGLKQISEMQKQLESIKFMHNEFNKRYNNSTLKTVFNCNFEFKNMSDLRFR